MDGDFSSRQAPSDDNELPPLWDGGYRPGAIAAFLMKLSGVDFAEARKGPADEQHKMARVGAALVFGLAFQVICLVAALLSLFGDDTPVSVIAGVVIVTAGVLFVVDNAAVASHWRTEGVVFCRANGLMRGGGPFLRLWRWLGRVAVVTGRLGFSYGFASLVAILLMPLAFKATVDRELLHENRLQNAHLVASAATAHARGVAQLSDQIKQLDEALKASAVRRAALLKEPTVDAALLRQIDELGKQVDGWRAAHAQATKDASVHAGDQNAERYGIQLHGGHTGQEGPGRRWSYYKDESQRRNAEAAALATQIDAGTKQLAGLRREAAEAATQNEAARSARLAIVEREYSDLVRRAGVARSARATLEEDRAHWIDRHVRADADYVPVSAALSDRLRVLLAIAQASPLMLTLMLFLKVTITGFECAGPIVKFLFTSCPIYSMRIALRVEEAVERELDRRGDAEALALRRQDHRHREFHRLRRAGKARDAAARTTDEIEQLIANSQKRRTMSSA